MAHTFRFLGQPLSDRYWLIADDGERHHCRKVLKLSAGATVEVTDGRGRGARGVLCLPPAASEEGELTAQAAAQAGPNAIWVAVDDSWQSPAPQVAVHMVLGAIKPGDWDQVLPPLAEIGVASVQVFACGASAKFRIDQKVKAKAEKILLGAIKQSKRDFMPDIQFWPNLDQAITPLLRDASSGQRFVLSANDAIALDDISPAVTGDVVIVVGDEAGLDAATSANLAVSGFRAISFGSAIYRAKTAAVCGAFYFRDRT